MNPPSSISAPTLLQEHGECITRYFDQILSRYPQAPARLLESIRYSLLAGGKRLRPALVLETHRACSTGHWQLTTNNSAQASAAAIELIHTFSLVHDDLPAMDNDDLRRGRPTNHKVFGEALAILAGDAMVTLAFELLAHDAAPHLLPRLVAELAAATGPEGMIGGQVLDMDAEHQRLTLDQLQQLHRRKTGALLACACRLGAIAAEAPKEHLDAVTSFGRHLGLAFQIVDDLLDVTSTPEQLGKATHKDAQKGKNTYPLLLGLDASRQAAAEQLTLALQSLTPLGPRAAGLQALARFVVERTT